MHERVSLSAPLHDWYTEGRQLRPFSFAAMYDGEMGLTVAVPLLLIKTVHEPLTGGYLVHRFTFKDNNFRDLSWMLLYTPSASRWFDKYAAVGFETDRNADPDGDGVTQTERDFALELGVKFRFRMETRLAGVPNFWGFRVGDQEHRRREHQSHEVRVRVRRRESGSAGPLRRLLGLRDFRGVGDRGLERVPGE